AHPVKEPPKSRQGSGRASLVWYNVRRLLGPSWSGEKSKVHRAVEARYKTIGLHSFLNASTTSMRVSCGNGRTPTQSFLWCSMKPSRTVRRENSSGRDKELRQRPR